MQEDRAEQLRNDFLKKDPVDRRKACAFWVTDPAGTELQQWQNFKTYFRFENTPAGMPVSPTRKEVKAFYGDVCADAPTASELLSRQPGRVEFLAVGITVERNAGNDLCETYSLSPGGAAIELYTPWQNDPDITVTHAEAALLRDCT
jgi:hypothetical protein